MDFKFVFCQVPTYCVLVIVQIFISKMVPTISIYIGVVLINEWEETAWICNFFTNLGNFWGRLWFEIPVFYNHDIYAEFAIIFHWNFQIIIIIKQYSVTVFIIQARTVYTGEPGSPFRTVDSFDTLTTSLVSECSTINELFSRAVKLYGDRDCVGARELLNEENEIQSNGKVFKKVTCTTFMFK